MRGAAWPPWRRTHHGVLKSAEGRHATRSAARPPPGGTVPVHCPWGQPHGTKSATRGSVHSRQKERRPRRISASPGAGAFLEIGTFRRRGSDCGRCIFNTSGAHRRSRSFGPHDRGRHDRGSRVRSSGGRELRRGESSCSRPGATSRWSSPISKCRGRWTASGSPKPSGTAGRPSRSQRPAVGRTVLAKTLQPHPDFQRVTGPLGPGLEHSLGRRPGRVK